MAGSIPKVQLKAIESLRSNRLSKSDYEDTLQQAAEKGWTDVIREALQLQHDQPLRVNSLLYEASKFGRDHLETVKVLLEAGGDPNSGSVMDYCGVESLQVLIEAGGDVNGRGGRPLLKAITQRAKQDKALALLAAGANPNVADGKGVTAVMHAAARGKVKVYDALVAAGADLYAIDKTGRSLARQIAESVASQRFHTMVTGKKNATRIARDLRDMLPAQPEDQVLLAIVVGDAEALNQMLDGGLDPNTMIEGSLGLTGLTFEETIKKGLKLPKPGEPIRLFPSVEDEDAEMGGMSLLMWAAATAQPDCVRALLEHGADPGLKNVGGLSAMTIVEKHVPVESIRHMLLRQLTGQLESEVQGRCERLGILRSEVQKQLLRMEERLELRDTKVVPRQRALMVDSPEARMKQAVDMRMEVTNQPIREKREIPPHRRASDIECRWEIAQLRYALDEADPIKKYLQKIAELARELFFGAHHQEPYQDCTAPLPHTAQWKAATTDWLKCYPMALAACSSLRQWKLADQLLTYPDENCERGKKSPMYNPEYYEWPLWMHMGAVAREEAPRTAWLEDMQKHATRRSKAVLATYHAIIDGNLKTTQKAIDRIVQAHVAYQQKHFKGVFASRCVSAEATYFFHLARRKGIEIEFVDSWDPYLMRLSPDVVE